MAHGAESMGQGAWGVARWGERAGMGFEAVWLWGVLLGGDNIVIPRPIHLVSAFYEAAIRTFALASASPGIIDYPFLVIRKPDAAETLKLSNRLCC